MNGGGEGASSSPDMVPAEVASVECDRAGGGGDNGGSSSRHHDDGGGDDLLDWLLTEGSSCETVLDLVREYVSRIRDDDGEGEGVPVDRFFVGCYLIHPQASAWIYKYECGQLTSLSVEKSVFQQRFELFGRDAPFIQLQLGAPFVRIGSATENEDAEAIPRDCRALFTDKGFTDLYGLPFTRRGKFSMGLTWATQREGGFTDGHVAVLNRTFPAVTTVLQLLLNELVTKSLLCTYLGNDPGRRVYEGNINRGDVLTTEAAVWFSDIRQFTTLSENLDRDSLVGVVNDVFERTERTVLKHGGEVLKFMGDGVLAIFRHEEEDDEEEETSTPSTATTDAAATADSSRLSRESNTASYCCCSRARLAAVEFQQEIRSLRGHRRLHDLPAKEVRVGVALHYGDCSYGNVGGTKRLDFTVLGTAVNLTSRVESLCSSLNTSILATQDFVARDVNGNPSFKSRGSFPVKGFADPVSVFEPEGSA